MGYMSEELTDRLMDKWRDGKVQTEASCVPKRRREMPDSLASGVYEREVWMAEVLL
jgi:hypothetical protein